MVEGFEKRIKRQVIGKKHRFFAVVQPGFEETARRELQAIGIGEAAECVPGGVEFESRLEGCYRANLGSRTITRLLMRLFEVKATNFRDLSRRVEKLPWELFLGDATTVGFATKCTRSRLYHEGAVEEELRRAIASRLAVYGTAVGLLEAGATQTIHVRLQDDVCGMSLDTSGEPLYLRGRKPFAVPATLRETLAAAILKEAGWPDFDVLIDPMCGAGTFTLEASEMMSGRLPNLDREFPFMRWPGFKPAAFAHLKKTLSAGNDAAEPGRRILASDLDPEAVETTRKNLAACGAAEQDVAVDERDFLDTKFLEVLDEIPDDARTLLVLNPPYGKRLRGVSTEQIYRRIGEAIRHHYRGAYAIIVPGLEIEKALSLPRDRKILFQNGGIRVAVIVKEDPREGE
jgi:putative N6-adenine-specific DNA methylase